LKEDIKKYVLLITIIGFVLIFISIDYLIINVNKKFVSNINERFIFPDKIVSIASEEIIVPLIKNIDTNDTYKIFNNETSLGTNFIIDKEDYKKYISYDLLNTKNSKKLVGYFNKKGYFIENKKINKKIKLLYNNEIVKADKGNIYIGKRILSSGKILKNGNIYLNKRFEQNLEISNKILYVIKYFITPVVYGENIYIAKNYIKKRILKEYLLDMKKEKNKWYKYRHIVKEIYDMSDYDNNNLFYKVVVKEKQLNSLAKEYIKNVYIKGRINKLFKKNSYNFEITSIEALYDTIRKDIKKIKKILNTNLYNLFNAKIEIKMNVLNKLSKMSQKKKKEALKKVFNKKILLIDYIRIEKYKNLKKTKESDKFIAYITVSNELKDIFKYEILFKKINNEYYIISVKEKGEK